MERVNNTFKQLSRCFCCYDGLGWVALLPEVEFAYNTTRALRIEQHTPFEANFGLLLRSPHTCCSTCNIQSYTPPQNSGHALCLTEASQEHAPLSPRQAR
jgi:hypothetical protein